jgi:hypothetical protein
MNDCLCCGLGSLGQPFVGCALLHRQRDVPMQDLDDSDDLYAAPLAGGVRCCV